MSSFVGSGPDNSRAIQLQPVKKEQNLIISNKDITNKLKNIEEADQTVSRSHGFKSFTVELSAPSSYITINLNQKGQLLPCNIYEIPSRFRQDYKDINLRVELLVDELGPTISSVTLITANETIELKPLPVAMKLEHSTIKSEQPSSELMPAKQISSELSFDYLLPKHIPQTILQRASQNEIQPIDSLPTRRAQLDSFKLHRANQHTNPHSTSTPIQAKISLSRLSSLGFKKINQLKNLVRKFNPLRKHQKKSIDLNQLLFFNGNSPEDKLVKIAGEFRKSLNLSNSSSEPRNQLINKSKKTYSNQSSELFKKFWRLIHIGSGKEKKLESNENQTNDNSINKQKEYQNFKISIRNHIHNLQHRAFLKGIHWKPEIKDATIKNWLNQKIPENFEEQNNQNWLTEKFSELVNDVKSSRSKLSFDGLFNSIKRKVIGEEIIQNIKKNFGSEKIAKFDSQGFENLIQELLNEPSGYTIYKEGARFDKKTTDIKHIDKTIDGEKRIPNTLIRCADGKLFELINTLTPEIASELTGLGCNIKDFNPADSSEEASNKAYKMVLGKGSFGKVRVARDIETGKLVAVKKFMLDPKADSQTLNTTEEAMSEIAQYNLIGQGNKQLINYIAHAHVAVNREIKNPDHNSSSPLPVHREKSYIFMELVPGVDALDWINHLHGTVENSEEEKAAKIKNAAKQMLQAVAELHQKGIAHRDIKLDNFLVPKEGPIKLCDFGFAIQKEFDDKTCGTPAYTAPEIRESSLEVGSEKSDYNTFKADSFSMGILLWMLKNHCYPHRFEPNLYKGHLYIPDVGPITLDFFRNNAQKKLSFCTGIDLMPAPSDLNYTTLDEVIFRLLNRDPENRISITDALKLPYFTSN